MILSIVSVAFALTIAFVGLSKRRDAGFLEDWECAPGIRGRPAWRPGDLPLLVALDPSAQKRWSAPLERSVQWWREQTGYDLFVVALPGISDARSSRVWLSTTDEYEPLHGTSFLTLPDCRIVQSEIRLPTAANSIYDDSIVRHELGHALGLAHDDYAASIMHLKATLRAQRVTAGDVELIRDAYFSDSKVSATSTDQQR